jgi:hypothetical protein
MRVFTRLLPTRLLPTTRLARRVTLTAAVAGLGLSGVGVASAATTSTTFSMLRSTAAVGAGCLAGANASVTIRSLGPVEVMTVKAHGLPANTDFDLFVIQTPDAPFGLSWYQGDLETGADGSATGRFVGRFSRETFTVAPGPTVAPRVHAGDATTNPATAPVHQFHLGLWFNSPTDAAAAGCPTAVTPFNGDHHAGVQALSTRQFPVTAGPLSRINP